jgi:riboflavin synthase
MFTGIIESLGELKKIEKEGANYILWIKCPFTNDLKIDQSVAHNGICLTVVEFEADTYKIVAIDETIKKTSIQYWQIGDLINLERGMKIGDRLDGHIVQGHVDETGTCIAKTFKDGSWIFTFEYDGSSKNLTIEKGSITVNGTSLTVVNSKINTFEVHIIPYTYEFTNINKVNVNDVVNLEFDVIGKYITKLNQLSN